MTSRARGVVRPALVALVSFTLLPACGGSRASAPPEATLADTIRAEQAFAPLQRRWLRDGRDERAQLEPDLDAFVRAYPADPLARLGRAWLGWIALDRGDVARAHVLVRPVLGGAPGTARDVASVVEGAALRRDGHPNQALRLLAPLVDALVDGYARDRLDEEVVAAALAAGRHADALRFMEVWLREANEEDRALVRSKVAAFVDSLPEPALLSVAERPRAGVEHAALEVPTMAAQKLASLAEQRHDVPLARRLLASTGPLLGDHAEPIARLASGGTSARVDARTVGLLLSTGDPVSRRRGAQAAAGLAVGLGLPGSSARVVTREAPDEGAATSEALAGLASDGAVLVVAGVNERQARSAAAFAESHAIPVLLLRPPGANAPASRFVFTVGDDPAEVGQVLAAALATRGVTSIAAVGEPDEPFDAQATKWAACGTPLPIAAWRDAGVQGLVLLGGSECAADTRRATEGSGLHLRVALGLETADDAPAEAHELQATAGASPFDAGTTISTLRAWLSAHGAAPAWFEALGHDAGVLAFEGVRSLPAQATEDPREVRARRAAATEALARAAAELWTTEAHGFEGGRVLRRHIGVREAR